MNKTIAQTDSFDPSSSEVTFKISIGDSSEYRLLPLLIKELAKYGPNISVESFLIPRKETPLELSAGNVDFCIDPPVHSDIFLMHQKIYEDDYVLIARKGHPIMKKQKIEMEEYLSETYGITVYQEQVMLLSQKLSGFSKGEADQLRKAMGKKDAKLLELLKPKFFPSSRRLFD